jgi:DNA-binding beta-propeller fold protein YncE
MPLFRRFGRLSPVLLAALVAISVLTMPAGADSGTPPTFLETIGGPLHAQMSPSGMEVGPSGEVVVADTGGNNIQKYAPDGTLQWQVGTHGSGTGEFLNPRDIAIDAAGDIYVADARNSRIVKLSPAGAWLTSFAGPSGDRISFPLGVSVSNGLVYVADTGYNRVRVFNTNGSVALTTPKRGCSVDAPRDADADADGNIYVANYAGNTIIKMSPTGACVTSWGGTGSGDGKFRTPYGVRLAVDPVLGTQLVYVADANNNRIQAFQTDGTFVGKFGSTGPLPPGDGQFFQLRRVAVAADGDVWGADLWGLRVARFDRTAVGWNFAQTIGEPLPPPTDTAVFQEPRQIAFDGSGNLIVVDTVHHRLVRMTPDGTLIGTCGQRGSANGQFNWPRGVAVDPATGQIWVANTKQYNLHVLQPDCTPITKFGDFGTGDDQFNWPYAIAIRPSDRIAFVVDTTNDRIKTYDVATRTFISSFGSNSLPPSQAPFDEPTGVAVSPVDGHVWVADAKHNRVVELSDTGGANLTIVRAITAGLNHPQGVAIDASGRIYIADSGNSRVVILSAAGAQLAEFSGPTGYDEPENLAVDSTGRLYVSDTYNDRIQVYAPFGNVPPPDTTPPDGLVTVPTPNQVLPAGLVTLSGTASDNVGVTDVKVAVKRTSDNKYLRANGSFGNGFVWLTATLAAPGAPSTGWSFSFTPPADGGYQLQVRTDDAATNTDPTRPIVNFSVAMGTPDTTAPDSTATSPVNASSFPVGPVGFAGNATDNVGVASVRLGIKNTATGQWWRTNGTWGTYQALTATLASPGAAATGWSYTWTAPAPGSYGISVEARDAAGNVEPAPKPWVTFTVTP